MKRTFEPPVREIKEGGSSLLIDELGLGDFAGAIAKNGYDEDLIKELRGADLDEFFESIGVGQAGIKLKVKRKLRELQREAAAKSGPPPVVGPFTAGKQREAKQLRRMGKDPEQIAKFLEVDTTEVEKWFDRPKAQPSTSSVLVETKEPKSRVGRSLRVFSQPRINTSVATATNTKTIVVVGETGAGKTTMLNAMINFCEGVNFEDDFRYELVNERKLIQLGYGGVKSTTQECNVYMMYCKAIQQYIRIVDTPGFKDVDGIKKDEKITEQIKQLFSHDLEVLDYVCICVPAPTAKLTGDQAYVFGRLMSIFGKDVEKRIIFLVTFGDAGRPQCINVLEAAQLPVNRWFKFNNSALMETDSDSMTEQFWDMGTESQSEFFNLISLSEPISLRMTQDVMAARDMLLKKAGQVENEMRDSLAASDRLKGLLQQLAKNEAAINANQNVMLKETVEKQRTERVGPNHTYCENCRARCHENCGYGDGEDKEGCCAMRNGFCTSCPKRCHWRAHWNYRDVKTVRWTETKMVQSATLVKLLDNARSDKSATDQLIEKFKNDMLQTLQTVGVCLVSMRSINEQLDEIALKKQPFSDFTFFDQLIAEEKMSKKDGYIERIEGYEQYKQRMKVTAEVATGNFELSRFVKLNEDEMGKLGVHTLQELDRDPVKKKQAWDEGRCTVS